jgi:hypothetical protein
MLGNNVNREIVDTVAAHRPEAEVGFSGSSRIHPPEREPGKLNSRAAAARDNRRGITQGSPISPVLANL